MPFGGDSFDHFRRGQQIRQFETVIRERLNSANDEIVKRIQSEEQEQELERKVVDEMKEFFRFSTRVAAQVLADIQQRKTDEVESKLEQEIQAFFEETKEHAMRVLAQIKQGQMDARAQLSTVLEKPVMQVTGAALAAIPKENLPKVPNGPLAKSSLQAELAALPKPVPSVPPAAAPLARPSSPQDAAKPSLPMAKPTGPLAKPSGQPVPQAPAALPKLSGQPAPQAPSALPKPQAPSALPKPQAPAALPKPKAQPALPSPSIGRDPARENPSQDVTDPTKKG